MNSRKILFIQIPCLNEADTIGEVIRDIPKKDLEKMGFSVQVLVIDDGSTDKTGEIAKKAGAKVLRHKRSLGLAYAFRDGLEYCLNEGAQIVVNTDGDNQYNQKEIIKLVKPVLEKKADMVIGDRQVEKLKFMPQSKKIGNLIGSAIIRFLTGAEVHDASSGFRAFSGELAEKFILQSSHTYTHETIIQSVNIGAVILDVPVAFKKRMSGESRLIGGIVDHIKKSAATILRTVLTYKAFKLLLLSGSTVMLFGFFGVFRFLFFYFLGDGDGHVQSLIVSSVLINLGFVSATLGVLADLISVNRKILEEIRIKIKNRK